MSGETAKYRLSLYLSQELIKETSNCRIEKVLCTLDEKIYLKRSYTEDKREVFYALQNLNNAHIPKPIQVIFDENTTIIEQYIDGKRLSELIESRQITKKQAYRVTCQIFEALSALHHNHIIHRDVKPDNILIDESGNAWLIDFGIARLYNPSVSQDTTQLGTVGYAPPEQFGFSQSDFRSDLYAAGMTVLEMGRFINCSPNAGLMKVSKRCTEFDPHRRYDSAAAVLRALHQRSRLPKLVVLLAVFLLTMTAIAFQQLQHKSKVPQVEEQTSATNIESSTVDITSDTDSLPIEWTGIVENYTEQGLPMLTVPAASDAGVESVQLAQKQPEINLEYSMSNGVLTLTLNDHQLPKQQFSFSYETSKTPDYKDTEIDAEIIFYDMNGDGQDEILIALSDRILLRGVKNIPICNTNWRAVWCVGYTQGEGFWKADGKMVSFGNHGSIYLNYLGERELFCSETFVWARLNGHSLEELN